MKIYSTIRMDMGDKSGEQFIYKMSYPKRGLFVLINNKSFDRKTGMDDRSGTDADAANLLERFEQLEFEVQRFNNQTVLQMINIFKDAATKYNHKDSDCFASAILSHGDEGVVFGTDAIIPIDSLVAPIKGDRCPSLVGKPKIFIIQACRGFNLDHGVEVADSNTETAEQKIYRIPSEADMLFCYSTVPGYFSWRNSTEGSWFVQALCKVLQEHGKSMDFLLILTRVNHEVAYKFESNTSNEFKNKKKQMPQIVSMLTKSLYFKSKGTAV